jgi:Uma2 family endonuclease
VSTAASYTAFVSPEDYLASEVAAECRHEYLNGMVYAMAGATQRHNDIAGNIFAALHAQMRGRPCRPYGSDMLVRVDDGGDLRFYYPDVSIICRPAGPESRVQSEPSVIFEVLSVSTARTDTGEKRMAYLTIATLEAYVLVDSTQRAVTVWRRQGQAWSHEVIAQPEDRLTFINDEYQLLVGEIYESTGL